MPIRLLMGTVGSQTYLRAPHDGGRGGAGTNPRIARVTDASADGQEVAAILLCRGPSEASSYPPGTVGPCPRVWRLDYKGPGTRATIGFIRLPASRFDFDRNSDLSGLRDVYKVGGTLLGWRPIDRKLLS